LKFLDQTIIIFYLCFYILLLIMRLIISFLLMLFPLFAHSQSKEIGIGQWRVHLSYNSANTVGLGEGKIYCASPSSFFSVDTDNQFNILSKIDGFSDVGISKIKYSEELKLLLITYSNGNLDILKGNSIININDIARKTIIGSKRINHIEFHGQYAFLSCDFGLVVLDCIKNEVKETFDNLSPKGIVTKVYSSTVFHDSLFIATDHGVMAANNNIGLNLQDYSNWYTFNSPTNNQPVSISNIDDKIIACFGTGGVYSFMNGTWNALAFPADNLILNYSFITKSRDRLIVGANSYLFTIEPDFTFTKFSAVSIIPAEAVFDNDGFIWVADQVLGLTTNKFSASPFELKPYRPNGPYTPFAWSLSYFDNKIVGVPGGYSVSGKTNQTLAGFYILEDNEWKNFLIAYKFPVGVLDLVSSYYNPNNKTLYLASFGSGLFAVTPDSTYIRYDTTNSTLVSAYIDNIHFDHPFVGDMKLDSKGRLWVVNTTQIVSSSLPTLHVLNPDGKWGKAKAFNNDMSLFLIQVLIDDNDYKWLRTMPEKTGGMIVYDSEKDTRTRILSSSKGAGALPSDKVQCMAKDKKGQIWIGTDKGVAVFYQPYTIFNSSNFDAGRPYVDGFPLLFDQSITCIKVDGGNRKWIGTTKGAWLFNEDGTVPILNFTAENSPLLSNNLKDIQINDVTGEVFFATDNGIISYRGTSTEADDKFREVKVFPNPVLPDFKGTIGITGLASNVSVKITDIFGNLIYETKSQGGMATWNARNYNGKSAKSGLYLIYCADETGTETLVSKIAVVD
jgi:ligand-binding sensor domain-containing protein